VANGVEGPRAGGGSSVGSRGEELCLSLGASGASRWPDLSASLLFDTGGPATLPASPFPAVDISGPSPLSPTATTRWVSAATPQPPSPSALLRCSIRGVTAMPVELPVSAGKGIRGLSSRPHMWGGAADPRERMEPGGRDFFSSSNFLVVEKVTILY
jgi:hypothetical protein